jgi:hypothetical protein
MRQRGRTRGSAWTLEACGNRVQWWFLSLLVGAGGKGLFGVSTDMGIAEAGINGVLNLAGWGGLGAGWNVWVVTRQVSTRPLCH